MSSMHCTINHHRTLPAQISLGRLSLPYSPAATLPRIRPPLCSPRCSCSLRFNQTRAELLQVYCRLLWLTCMSIHFFSVCILCITFRPASIIYFVLNVTFQLIRYVTACILWFAGAADVAALSALASKEARSERDSAAFLREGKRQYESIKRRLHQASGSSYVRGSSFILVSSHFAFLSHSLLSFG